MTNANQTQPAYEYMKYVEQAKRSNLTRRMFIAGTALYTFLRPAVGVSDGKMVETTSKLDELANSLSTDDYASHSVINNLFGIEHDDMRLAPSIIHPRYFGIPHPNDLDALAPISRGYFDNMSKYEIKREQDLILRGDFNTQLIVSGSPMANAVSRTILGYENIGTEMLQGLRQVESKYFDLRFQYEFDGALLSRQTELTERLVGTKIHEVPNWSVRDLSSNKLLIPPLRNKKNLLVTIS